MGKRKYKVSKAIDVKKIMPNDHYLLPAFAEKYMEGVVISGG